MNRLLNLIIATFVIQKRNGTFGVCICCLPQVKGFGDSCALGSDEILCSFLKGRQAKSRNTGILNVMYQEQQRNSRRQKSSV